MHTPALLPVVSPCLDWDFRLMCRKRIVAGLVPGCCTPAIVTLTHIRELQHQVGAHGAPALQLLSQFRAWLHDEAENALWRLEQHGLRRPSQRSGHCDVDIRQLHPCRLNEGGWMACMRVFPSKYPGWGGWYKLVPPSCRNHPSDRSKPTKPSNQLPNKAQERCPPTAQRSTNNATNSKVTTKPANTHYSLLSASYQQFRCPVSTSTLETETTRT